MINRIEQLRLKLLKEGRKIINLSSGNTNGYGIHFPKPILKKALQKFWVNTSYKPDPKGLLEARKAIALFYKKRGWQVDPENIILTSGTSESYFHIFKWLSLQTAASNITQAPTILLPRPGYPLFEEIGRLAGAETKFYELEESNGWQINIQILKEQVQKYSPKAIVLVSPHNPTGSVLNTQSLQNVINICQKQRISIISDEVFSEYIFDSKSFPRVAQMCDESTIFTLNGISKSYCLPGLKLSWLVVNGPNVQEIIEELERSADVFLSTNYISQNILPSLLKEGQKFLKNTRQLIEHNRNLAVTMLDELPNISFHKPEGGFYLFAKIDGLSISDEEFVLEFMEKTSIFIHPGYFYDYDDGLYIVISLAFKSEQFKKYLQKLVNFI